MSTPINKIVKDTRINPSYPVKIYCIVRDYNESNDVVLHAIRDHTNNSGGIFMTRIYDSRKYSADRDFIERLPALHAYVDNRYIRTFYPNTRPLQHVDECIEIHVKRLNAKENRKGIWKNTISSLMDWFKKLTHRKTRMERYEENKAKTLPVEWGSRRF